MKKTGNIIGAIAVVIFGIFFWWASNEVFGGVFKDTRDAIIGHTQDIRDRLFTGEKYVDAYGLNRAQFEHTKDLLHWAKGTVSIRKNKSGYYVQLHGNFDAAFAPDLYVVLSDKVVTNQEQLDLIPKPYIYRLKKPNGASYYKFDESIKVKSVIIWCKRFNQFMGSAIL